MEISNINRHISGQFNSELENVRNQIMQMGGLIEQQLKDVLTALADNDIKLAEEVVAKDKYVNEFEFNVDQECARIIAKRQPTASDLRLILATMKSISELERIGDSVASIGKMLIENKDRELPSLTGLEHMGELVLKMLHDTLDSFTRMDLKSAIMLYNEDKKVNRQYESMVRELMTFMMEDPRSIPFILKVLASARAIERIGDRCQNLCEQVIYLVKGVDVRHATKEEINSLLSE
jgi:phosphate transport system protein